MRSKSQALIDKIYSFINDYYGLKHSSPSVNEIAKGVGVAKTTAYRYIIDMNENGLISYDGQSIETAEILKSKTDYFSAPLLGSIRCGDPENESENIEEYVSLPTSLFGSGEFFLLRAVGDSMTDAGINEGDLVVIKKETAARVGDIVVALDENNENTLKTYAGIDNDSSYALLRYENQKAYPGKVIKVKKLVVQGVAKHIIKSL